MNETFTPLSIGQITRYIRELLSQDDLLSGVWLRGEASNVTRHASGHLYFTLKDEDAQLRCAMWRPDAGRLRFPVEVGARYLAYGQVTLYEKRGDLSFVAEHLEPDGRGALHIAYERLKARLAAEGLFDEARKRPLPFLPRRVGLITSPTGAALHDMVRILRERHPRLDLVVIPARVQGDAAPESIAQAIVAACGVERLDVLIVGRGGGSLEDLWAFNDERVVRALANCPIPLVSAVGHETDFTLADFVADARAATPTAAAALVVPLAEELREFVAANLQDAARLLDRHLTEGRRRVERSLERAAFAHPLNRVLRHRQELERQSGRLCIVGKDLLRHRRERTAALAGRLHALSPLGVLARGYALVRHDGKIVRRATEALPGDRLDIHLRDGCLVSVVEEVSWTTEIPAVELSESSPRPSYCLKTKGTP